MSDERKIIEYGAQSRPILWYRRPLSLPQLMLAVLAVAVIVYLFTPTITRRPHADYARTRCLSDMRMLGQMIYLYTAEHKSYPDSLATLARLVDVADRPIFCCPELERTATTQATTQQFLDLIRDPVNEPILYLFPGENPQAGQILLVERSAMHGDSPQANIVLLDGSARSISAAQHQQILEQINAGQTKIFLPP
jgi:competence protein ComGC